VVIRVAAIVGREEVMREADDSLFQSTIGPTVLGQLQLCVCEKVRNA